ncbi:hypothetical protein DOTSEDRAFT_39274 [Dothistroma septosporum NZE10]|uniref:Uncharacterized protein n=1 Tax=Dothistroma septosporum (strain NZE10 / CBS 128990) TaxID=675120 RepID=N1PCT6_DOTSN|nr:hypothetical protein DOTSEDRAFT_39274 [Dothistroma septosporum NZE10]
MRPYSRGSGTLFWGPMYTAVMRTIHLLRLTAPATMLPRRAGLLLIASALYWSIYSQFYFYAIHATACHTPVASAWAEISMADEFRDSYNELFYTQLFSSEFEHVAYRNRVQDQIIGDIKNLRLDANREYNQLFKSTFLHRVDEARILTEGEQYLARHRMMALIQKLTALHGNVSSWTTENVNLALEFKDTRARVLSSGRQIWLRRFEALKAEVDDTLKQFSFQGQPLQYVGSLVEGVRGRHKGRTALDFDEFDLDLFVVHAEEWHRHEPVMEEFLPHNLSRNKIFPNGTHLRQIRELGSAVGAAVAARLRGEFNEVVMSKIRDQTEIALARADRFTLDREQRLGR